MRLLAVLVALIYVVAGGCGSAVTVLECVPGSAQLCACATGATGSQVCQTDSTFAACVCEPSDGGLQADGGLLGDDVGETPDAHPSDVDMGTGSCPTPLITCGARCVDPMTDPAYCGASSDCSGANAGTACGVTWCSSGRCVWNDCFDARQAGNTTDGLYLLDIDGSGPRPPADGYCDMTTDGGGWTLVYKVGNTVPDIAEPWYPMVALGSGTALPTTLGTLPAGTYFEGPDRDTRLSLQRVPSSATGFDEWRAQLLSAAGDTVFDVRVGGFGSPLDYIVRGTPGMPSGSWISGASVLVIGTSGTLPPLGTIGSEVGGSSCGSICDWDAFQTVSPTAYVPLAGDATISRAGSQFANSTTLLWTRPHYGAWP